jgi:hypothetical protein
VLVARSLDRHAARNVSGLDQPTSVDFIGDAAFVVTLTGTIVRIDGL